MALHNDIADELIKVALAAAHRDAVTVEPLAVSAVAEGLSTALALILSLMSEGLSEEQVRDNCASLGNRLAAVILAHLTMPLDERRAQLERHSIKISALN